MSNSLLITGVAGFIGRYVARYFIERDWSVIGIDNSPPENAPLASLKAYHRLRLPDPTLATLIASHSPQVLIHCAERASVGSSITDPTADFYGNRLVG